MFKVVIVDSLEEDEVVVKRSITGYQPGEMFGASLAVSDLNGDKRDDIIIGAPYHSDYSANDITFESGAVYVYYKNSVGEYRRGSPHEFVLRGKANAGRFGYSLAALGDIDGDGFNDLAIGAPYQGAGTVYVYLGSRNGLRSTASQVINGKQFTPEIRSFGFAMAAQDFDGCLAVGAFQSDAVVYLPSKPVVRLFAELEFTPGNITFEERHCKLLSDDVTPCSEMRYCLKYSGQRVPQNIDVEVSIKLDSHRDMNQRLFFLRTGKYEMNKSLRLKFQETKCWEEKVVIKSTLRDVSSPIHVNLVSSLITRPNDLAPVLDVNSANGSVFETLFVTGLNNSQLCTQNLQLTINK